MNIPDSILLALDRLASGEALELIPEVGLEPDCRVVVGHFNQLVARLRQEELNTQALLGGETLPTLVSRIPDGRLLYANARAKAMFRLEGGDPGSHQVDELWVNPELRQAFVDKVCLEGRVDSYEVDLHLPDGSPYCGLLSASRMTFRGQDAILSSFQSITERRLLEQRLGEALDLNRKLFEASPLGIAAYRIDTGQCVLANPAMCHILGGTKDQILAQHFRSIPSWKTHGLLPAAERCLAGNETTHVTTPLVTSFGRALWILATFTTFTSNHELHLLLTLMDVTERVQSEQALRKSHTFLDEVGELARVGGWELDLALNALTWSRVVREIHEVGPDYQPEVATAISFYAPEAIPVITQAVQSAIEEGCTFDHQLPIMTAKGNRRWVRAIGKPHVEEGRVVRISGVFQDITVLRAQAEKLHQLVHVVEQSPVSILITDVDGTIEFANPKACEATGYALEELLGQNPRRFKSGEQSPEFYQNLWQTLLSGRDWRGAFHNRRKNGDLFWEQAVVSPLRDESGRITHLVAVKEDVTARILAEEARQALVVSLQEALDNVKLLQGLLPICAGCKKIRDEAGYWNQLEHYFSEHGDVRFTHGLCPDCAKEFFPKQSKP